MSKTDIFHMTVYERAGELAPTRDRLAQAIWICRRYSRQCDVLCAEIARLTPAIQVGRNGDILSRIKVIVDTACYDAERELRLNSREAINWGDLGCADVGTKNDGYYAVIQEASPTATELMLFVYDRLVAGGYPNVEVSAEW